MATIKLEVDKEWRVVVTSLDANDQNDKKGGNLDLLGGSQIVWKASSNPGWVEKYKITFKDSANTTQKVWPFAGTEPSDRILQLNRGQSVTLTTLGGDLKHIKYDVLVETNASTGNPGKVPEPVDPVIIIRPGLRSIIAAGLPWAVAGAAIGALITWSIFVR